MNHLERQAGLRGVPDNPLPIQTIRDQFNGQWVLARVNSMDEQRTPLEGTVIAHGRRGRVHQTALRLAKTMAETDEKPDLPYYIFSARSLEPLVPSSTPIVDELIRKASQEMSQEVWPSWEGISVGTGNPEPRT